RADVGVAPLTSTFIALPPRPGARRPWRAPAESWVRDRWSDRGRPTLRAWPRGRPPRQSPPAPYPRLACRGDPAARDGTGRAPRRPARSGRPPRPDRGAGHLGRTLHGSRAGPRPRPLHRDPRGHRGDSTGQPPEGGRGGRGAPARRRRRRPPPRRGAPP